jgi:hypothetical protein
MRPRQTYIVLAARGAGWEPHGPLATEYRTLKEAEAAARDLSVRYPQRTIGVYELRAMFDTKQLVVKQKVTTPVPMGENVIKLRKTT